LHASPKPAISSARSRGTAPATAAFVPPRPDAPVAPPSRANQPAIRPVAMLARKFQSGTEESSSVGAMSRPRYLAFMLLAELEIRHSRAVVPTRRVALGLHWLPAEPAPGPGGVLLGGLVAAHADAID